MIRPALFCDRFAIYFLKFFLQPNLLLAINGMHVWQRLHTALRSSSSVSNETTGRSTE